MANAPDKRTVIDALVVACTHSRLADVVGTDALRSVLDVEYRELTSGGSFDLQQLWELLEEQPGFDPEHAKPPLLRFKSWERNLGLPVVLPEALAGMSESERVAAASECQIPAPEIKRLFRSDLTRAAAQARERRASGKLPAVRSATASGTHAAVPRWRRPSVGLVAAAVALGCFAFAGVTLYRQCDTSPDFESVSEEFAGEIPLRDARRFGDQVGATLSDDAWLGLDEATRGEHMRAALERLGEDVTVFYLRDASNAVKAIAQRRADGKVQLTFR